MGGFVVPAALAGASFLGGLFKNKTQQSTVPQLDPAFGGLQSTLIRLLQRRLAGTGGLESAGLTNRRIAGVNQAFRGADAALQNKLRASGIGQGSGVIGGAEAGLEEARAGQIGGLLAEEPLLSRQLQNEDFSQALNLLGLGRGSLTTTTSGGGLGGGITDVGSILGFLYGSGLLGGGEKVATKGGGGAGAN